MEGYRYAHSEEGHFCAAKPTCQHHRQNLYHPTDRAREKTICDRLKALYGEMMGKP